MLIQRDLSQIECALLSEELGERLVDAGEIGLFNSGEKNNLEGESLRLVSELVAHIGVKVEVSDSSIRSMALSIIAAHFVREISRRIHSGVTATFRSTGSKPSQYFSFRVMEFEAERLSHLALLREVWGELDRKSRISALYCSTERLLSRAGELIAAGVATRRGVSESVMLEISEAHIGVLMVMRQIGEITWVEDIQSAQAEELGL